MTTDEEHTLIRMMREHMDESARWRAGLGERIDAIEQEQNTMRDELQRNTEITSAVHDAYTAGKVATRLIRYVAGISVAIASIWWAVREIAGQAGPGGGIGPTP